MEARTVNNLSPAALHDDAVRCLLAIELSKKSWIVAVSTPLSDKISRYTLKPCDWRGLLELIARIRTRVARELKKLWLRHQPASSLSVWFQKRVGNVRGRIRRITIVAMARKLLVALWRYLETGVVPEGATLKG